MLHEPSEEDGKGEENKYPTHEPGLKLGLRMFNVEPVNEQGQHHKEDHEVEDYHERFAPRSPLVPARPTHTHTVTETQTEALLNGHFSPFKLITETTKKN